MSGTAKIADVVVSNCVLNIVPNKDGVIKEIYRGLKPGEHLSISDIVLEGELQKHIKEVVKCAGCVAGAIKKQVYLELIEPNEFRNITVQKTKELLSLMIYKSMLINRTN